MAAAAQPQSAAELQGLQRLMLIGAISGLVVIPVAIVYRARVFARRHDINTEMPSLLYETFIRFIAGLDFAMALNVLAGYLIRGTRHDTRAAGTVLGALQQLEEVASLWIKYRMGEMPFRFLVLKDDTSDMGYFLHGTLKGVAGLGLLFTVPPLAANIYGDNGLYFWFRYYHAEFYALYWFALLVCLQCAVNFARVSRVSAHRRRRARRHVRHGDYYRRMTFETAAFLTAAGALWLLPYVLRTISWGHARTHGGQRARWCQMLDVFAVGFRGPLAALLYVPKDGVAAAYRLLRRLWAGAGRRDPRWGGSEIMIDDPEAAAVAAGENNGKDKKYKDDDGVRLMLLGRTRPLPFFTALPPPRFEERRVFASTFNCGECPLAPLVERLGEWIPRGMAVYVIGVQECMVMDGLKEAILDHVGRETYMCWDDAIGSTVKALGFHGMIGLFVLARTEDVLAGNFMIYESQRQKVARGKNLGVARAENKGGVGLAFRYHDICVGVLTAHLASDSKGRSKLAQRMQDARNLLATTALWGEAYKDLDVQHQHHVTIFLGDLNYRIRRRCPRRVLEDVARLCRHEKEARYADRDDWRRVAYEGAVLTGELSAASGPATGGVEGGNGGGGSENGAEDGDGDESECSSHDAEGDEEDEEDDNNDNNNDEEEGLPPVEETAGEEEAHRRVSILRFRRPALRAKSSYRESVVRETWEEFVRADELRQAMQAGEILHGFVEGEIRFPPTYRRRRGPAGACGDYADACVLQEAYSTHVADKTRLTQMLTAPLSVLPATTTIVGGRAARPAPRATAKSSSSSASASSSSFYSSSSTASPPRGPAVRITTPPASAASSKSSLVVPPPPPSFAGGGGRHSSIRIPSYTDRILLYVQPERRGRVTLRAYESCDAIDASDHVPVSGIISIRVDTGLKGLGSFLPMIRQHPSATRNTTTTIPSPDTTASSPSVPRPPPPPAHTVCSVQDAAFFQLLVSNVTVDFAPGAARPGLFAPGEAARPDHSILLCPLAFEDVYRDLRRPALVATMCGHVGSLTATPRANPFGYAQVKRWRDVEKGGFALVTCLRPEFGMRAAIYVRSRREGLGSAVLPLTDETGRPLAEQKGLRVPTTRGSVHTGYLTCDVRLVQLAVPPRKQWW